MSDVIDSLNPISGEMAPSVVKDPNPAWLEGLDDFAFSRVVLELVECCSFPAVFVMGEQNLSVEFVRELGLVETKR